MQKPLYHYLYIRSPILKIALGIISVLFMLAVIVYTAVTEPVRMEAQVGNWDGREIEKGAMLFHNNCANCHGNHGRGGAAPALNSRYFFEQRAADVGWTGTQSNFVKLTIAAGRPNLPNAGEGEILKGDQWSMGIMPTWSIDLGGPLRGDQVDAVTAYVMNWESSAVKQTPAEDPWVFFQNVLAKALPYEPDKNESDKEGYEDKVAAAVAAARISGVESYELEGETYEFVTEDAAASADESDEEVVRTPQELYASTAMDPTAMNCAACHNINENQTGSNRGGAGPHQGNLHETAANRVEGLSAEEYVYNSIVNPGDYIVDGYADGVMPRNFAELMSEEEIRGLAAWMLDPNREQ